MECGYPHHSVLIWEDIHLYAQTQGVLYSLRILQQIIAQVKGALAGGTMEALVELLHEQLSKLPPLEQLLPSRYQLGNEQRSNSYWGHVMTLMFSLLEEEHADFDLTDWDDQKDGVAGRIEVQDVCSEAHSPIEGFEPQKKRRRKEITDRTAVKAIPPDGYDNMYGVLDIS